MIDQRLFLPLLALLCLTSTKKTLSQTSNHSQNFTINIPTNASTSAGVFKSDGALVRTLWGNEPMKAGTYTKTWDGKDDLGNTVAKNNYHVELLRSNVQYAWDGIIGNTTKLNSGSREDVDRWIFGMSDAVVIGTKLYFTVNWAEGNSTLWTKSTLDINKAFVPVRPTYNDPDISTQFCATDGINIYWAGFDTHKPDHSWIYATKVSDNSDYIFPNGSDITSSEDGKPRRYYPSIIDYKEQTIPTYLYGYTALSVQKNGDFLFSLRGPQNVLRVLNKTTGALVQTVSLSNATAMRTDLSNGLWIAFGNRIKKYTVNSNGTITDTGLTIGTGLSRVTYMNMNLDGSQLVAIDAGANQQVKAFNNTTGELVWTMGEHGGYQTNSNVNNFKYMFGSWPIIPNQNTTNGLTDKTTSFLTYQPDGKLWVNDAGNNRQMRFNTNRTFDSLFMLQPTPYMAFVHPTDPTRVYSGASGTMLEWEIDYSKTLDNGLNDSWKLKRNWSGALTNGWDKSSMGMTTFAQLPNGRVYCTVRSEVDGWDYLHEMVTNGVLRNTGVKFFERCRVLSDGTLITAKDVQPGLPYNFKRTPLINFDANNNPNWGTNSIYYDAVPGSVYISLVKNDFDPHDATNTDFTQVTTSGKQVFFDGTTTIGWHLGFIKLKTDGTVATNFLTKTSLSTRKNYTGDFPRDGRYDIGNGVIHSGGDFKVFGNNIIWSYRGEFWKSVQTNYFNHFYENGLPVGQFGVGGHEATNYIQEGMAGNALNWNITKVDADNAYLYQGDESHHAGIHRWSIKNLSSIKVDTIALGSALAIDVAEGIDLMAGLNSPYTLNDNFSVPADPLQDGVAGWSRSPATNYYNHNEDKFSAVIGTKSYDKNKGVDLFINSRKPANYSVFNNTNNPNDIPTISSSVTRDLQVDVENSTTYNTFGASSWKLSGKLNYEGIYQYNSGSDTRNGGGQSIEVLDNNGKIITRIYPKDLNDGSGKTGVYGNNTPIFTMKTTPDFFRFMNVSKDFTISVNSTGADYNVADFPAIHTTFVDATANWQNPKTLRFYFWTWNENRERTIGVRDLRFGVNKDNITTPGAPTLVADDVANTLTASHALGNTEILVSENGGAFIAYTGQISVGNGARPAGYWKFKTKAVLGRNESTMVNSPAFTEVTATTPNPPTFLADDASNTLIVTHPLGNSDILVSENEGAFVQYTGQINVGDVARAAGYWKFKTKAGSGRNESAVVNSPAFTEVTANTPNPPTFIADDAANTLIVTHPLGNSEILVSENGGAFVQYTGQINVGNVARAAGYWKFKTKAVSGRNESAVVNSPQFTTASVAQCSATGAILYQIWKDINGLNISNNNWTQKSTSTTEISSFEAPANVSDMYAARISGYICPPQTGNYTFWVSGDDATQLWLSNNADPANKRKIAYNDNWTGVREWGRYNSQKSVEIYLEAGNKYYIEALLKENTGEDNLSVAWTLPSGDFEAPIPGSHLSPFSSGLNANLSSVEQCFATGSILSESWNNVNGLNIVNNDWTKATNSTSEINSFEVPKNEADLYAKRVRGYVCPPQTGNYTFWISGDDATELWLSTDDNPANKTKIAYNQLWTGFREWNRYQTQKSGQIYLKAGFKYYVEALLKENYGEDNLSVAWQLPNGNMETPIPGSRLSPFSAVAFSSETNNSSGVNENKVENSTALNDEILEPGEKSIYVYPNPIISNNIFIQSNNLPAGKYSVSFINSLGATIFRESINHPGGLLKHSISISSGLSKGIYLLHLSGKDLKFSKQLLK